jgi:hypothetical protein
VLTAALALAALAAGLAGGWSPCGLSMVETLNAAQTRAGRAAGALAFAAGALAGGLVTFGGLALAGEALGGGGGAWTAAAALAIVAASAGDVAGRRIVPQVRRQVPESWRRRLPLPVASALYGVLLGLGFTTFVLSFATYALAACALALGDPVLGAAIGAGFAAGRALPVVAAAPRPHGALAAAMAERPGVLRALRAAAAVVLLVAAGLALAPAPASAAAQLVTADGTDPSATEGALVWQDDPGAAVVLRGGRVDRVPGADAALGADRIAWHDERTVTVARLDSFAPLVRFAFPGVEELAVGPRWLAWLTRGEDGIARIYVIDLDAPTAPPRVMARASELGRPSLDGDRLAYHVSGTKSSRIATVDLVTGDRFTLRRSVGSLLLNPTLSGDRLLYVESTATRQRLRLGDLRAYGGADRSLFSTTPTARRDAGHEPNKGLHHAGYPDGVRPRMAPRPARGVTVTLWTTAIDATMAYVTSVRHLPAGATAASLLKVALPVSARQK